MMCKGARINVKSPSLRFKALVAMVQAVNYSFIVIKVKLTC